MALAAESLLRSLVGVSAAVVNADRRGRVAGIVVTPAPGIGGRQLARNVASALMARFGMVVDPAAIIIGAASVETSSMTADPTASPLEPPSSRSRTSQAHGAPRTNGNGHAVPVAGEAAGPSGKADKGPADAMAFTTGTDSAVASQKPAGDSAVAGAASPSDFRTRGQAAMRVPRIDTIELTPVPTGLRCRVVVGVGGDRFVGIGDAAVDPAAQAELAARVTVDALRAARVTSDPIQFEGATIVRVAGQPHAVTALSFWTGSDFERRSGAEPVTASMAEAAARSVIRTVMSHLGELS
ncbi:MAG: hypothetical protein L0271_14455 [Gemmatimonadetes bacterium]|nr:hypothetical protein [Gemmatimonadota bacterium]